jgi:hypothetical protein
VDARSKKRREATLVRADGVVSSAELYRPEDFAGLTTILCFALSRSRFAPVCGFREAQARQREALIKGGFASSV